MNAEPLLLSAPCGLSFSIADLILVKGWADAQSLRLTIHLDHGIEGEEYEEVLAFSKRESSLCQWILWRNAEHVFVQPLIGRPQCYASVADALNAVCPPDNVTVTDINPTSWPH